MAYWDTGCLLKLYVTEPNSAYFKALVLSNPRVVTSEIAQFEVFAALHRKEAITDLPAGGAARALVDWNADISTGLIQVIPISIVVSQTYQIAVEHCYRQSPALQLRTLDAIHLASALASQEPQIVATDKRLRDAAVSMGLVVLPQ